MGDDGSSEVCSILATTNRTMRLFCVETNREQDTWNKNLGMGLVTVIIIHKYKSGNGKGWSLWRENCQKNTFCGFLRERRFNEHM
jgi:hypothetical protein